MIRWDNNLPDDYEAVIESFVADLPQALLDRCENIVEATTKLRKPNAIASHELGLSEFGRMLRSEWFDFVKIDIKYKHTPEQIALSKSEGNSKQYLNSICACLVAGDIEDVICYAQLAYPGRIHNAATHVYIRNASYNRVQSVGGLPYDFLIPSESNWPNLETIPLARVSAWEKKIGLFDQGIAQTPIQRALASFTNAVGRNNNSVEELLFWVMQGLESFYCRGTGDLRKQLADKTRIFLGPWSDNKNIVGKMYDMRSKFVHGGFNLERWNNSYEIEEKELYAQNELYEASKLATQILIATLHRCVNEELSSVEFEYLLRVEKLNQRSNA